jgi:plasmid stabilization system protein ParE
MHIIESRLFAKQLDSAVEYYIDIHNSLAINLLDDIETNLQSLINYPDSGYPVTKTIRKIHLSGFPFHIYYKRKKDTLLLVAFIHFRRANRKYAL